MAQSSAGNAAAVSSTFPFMALPFEIRDMVYAHYMADDAVWLIPHTAKSSFKQPDDIQIGPSIPSLLLTCRQVSREFESHLYKHSVVYFHFTPFGRWACTEGLLNISVGPGPLFSQTRSLRLIGLPDHQRDIDKNIFKLCKVFPIAFPNLGHLDYGSIMSSGSEKDNAAMASLKNPCVAIRMWEKASDQRADLKLRCEELGADAILTKLSFDNWDFRGREHQQILEKKIRSPKATRHDCEEAMADFHNDGLLYGGDLWCEEPKSWRIVFV